MWVGVEFDSVVCLCVCGGGKNICRGFCSGYGHFLPRSKTFLRFQIWKAGVRPSLPLTHIDRCMAVITVARITDEARPSCLIVM